MKIGEDAELKMETGRWRWKVKIEEEENMMKMWKKVQNFCRKMICEVFITYTQISVRNSHSNATEIQCKLELVANAEILFWKLNWNEIETHFSVWNSVEITVKCTFG